MAETFETKIKEYLPDHVYQIDDIKASAKAIDTEISKLWSKVNKYYANAFIDSADEDGIKIFERELGITPDPDESIEERRAHAKVLWNYSVPFTENFLREYLEGIYGEDGYVFSKDSPGCEVNIFVRSFDELLTKRVRKILRRMIPAHIGLNITQALIRDSGATVYVTCFTYAPKKVVAPIREGYKIQRETETEAYQTVAMFTRKKGAIKENE